MIEPSICYAPQPWLIEKLPASFPELTPKERSEDWAKEFMMGRAFAREMDFYRALTCFKRALLLIPKKIEARRLQIEYEIFLAYYVANKYEEAIETFENGQLFYVSESFPALHDLLIALYDAYNQIDKPERAYCFWSLLYAVNPDDAIGLTVETSVLDADLKSIEQAAQNHPTETSVSQFLCDYEFQAKSISKAQTLNALLPGAGYYYVGQKKAALTSFLINTLFIAASYQLFDRGYIPGAIILTSLEMGWYFGGINGAGLAAKEYNERLYETLGKEMLINNRLFPILMFQKGF